LGQRAAGGRGGVKRPGSDLWLPDGALRRRELLQAGAGTALALGLSACGIGRGLQGDTDRVIEPKVDGDLYYYNYSQYINPALVKEFEQKYDVRVIESYFDSMEGMLAKLRAGNTYDVIFPTAEYIQRLVQEQQILRIPRDKLNNLDNIYPYFDDPWYDPDSAHSVPYSMYITGIGYRADLIDNMSGSWNDLANPEAEGRIYVLDDFQEALAAGNLVNGFDMNTVVESELEQSKQWLIDLKPGLRGFSVDTITNMSSGNGWIVHLWNGDIINIRYRVDDPDAYQFQKITEDGFPVGSDAFVIPVNAEHPGTALLFMDFMLDPKNAAKNVSWNGYPMPNKGQDQTFADLAKGDPEIVVTTEDLESGDQFANLEQQDRELWTNTWLEVKAS
jgi:spermidine/putrescine transport system substrate-binding protein